MRVLEKRVKPGDLYILKGTASFLKNVGHLDLSRGAELLRQST